MAVGDNLIKLIDAAGFGFNVLDQQGNLITEIYDTNADNHVDLSDYHETWGRLFERTFILKFDVFRKWR